MMWKESYRIGVESVDRQHRKLFEMVENLLEIIRYDRGGDSKEGCIEAVAFLRDYAVRHFTDEEEYQVAVGYEGLEEHKELHRNFVVSVLDYAKKMEETDYDMSVVRSFSGFLTAWLVYHVADADQRIVGKIPEKTEDPLKSYADNFSASIYEVFETMMGLRADEIRKIDEPERLFEGDMFVEVGLTGDINGKVVFIYSREFAQAMMNAFMPYEMKELEEVVSSAMAEISNIVSGRAATKLSNAGVRCNIEPPLVAIRPYPARDNEGFHMETPGGDLQVLLAVE